jgi:spoIIIJ-associated protein
MDYVEKEALTVPEAVFAAARMLGIDEREAQVQVLSAPGARRVRVRVGRPGVFLPPVDAPAAEAPSFGPEERMVRPPEAPSAPSIVRTQPNPEQAARAKADLERLLAAMGTPGTVEIKERAGNLVLNVLAPAHENLLIGHRGQTAEALQHLILEFMHHLEGDPSLYLVVDIGDYFGRAEQRLIEKALQAAEQVKRDGGQVSLGSLSPAERRVVHVTLKSDAAVETFSVGNGSIKKLFIQKKG